jgi:hypothetical protein
VRVCQSTEYPPTSATIHSCCFVRYQVHSGTLWYTLVHSGTLMVHSGTLWYTLVHTRSQFARLVAIAIRGAGVAGRTRDGHARRGLGMGYAPPASSPAAAYMVAQHRQRILEMDGLQCAGRGARARSRSAEPRKHHTPLRETPILIPKKIARAIPSASALCECCRDNAMRAGVLFSVVNAIEDFLCAASCRSNRNLYLHYRTGLLFDCSFFSTILSGTGAHGECATFDVWVEAFGVELFFPLKTCEYPMALSDLEIPPDL